MSTRVHLPPVPLVSRVTARAVRRRVLAQLRGVLFLAAAYFAAAKVGQTLRYTASVAAMWPPAGVGIAALYLRGTRWWPGIFVGECIVNAQLIGTLPLAALVGQQAGN